MMTCWLRLQKNSEGQQRSREKKEVQRARMLPANRNQPLAKPIVDVLKRHPAGAGTFHLDATTTGRAAGRRRGRSRV